MDETSVEFSRAELRGLLLLAGVYLATSVQAAEPVHVDALSAIRRIVDAAEYELREPSA